MTVKKEKYNFEALLFDLDGTLLRVQMATFISRYVHSLASYCADQVKPRRFEKTMLTAIRDLIYDAGDGVVTNEQRFYTALKRDLGLSEDIIRASLIHFEQNELSELQGLIHPVALAQKIIADCAKKNIPMVLATNPVFPRFVIQARMKWAGLEEASFDYITSYENSHHCKPQPGYFTDLAAKPGVAPQACLMIGNDLNHDLSAVGVGMKAWLVDTWLVGRGEPEWPCEYRGDHRALQVFLEWHL